MSKLLNKIPVIIRILILIGTSIGLGISLFWAYSQPNETEPKLSVATSLVAILVLGADVYGQINSNSTTQSTHSTHQTHRGTGDIIGRDKISVKKT